MKKRKKQHIFTAILLVLVLVAAFSLYQIISETLRGIREEKAFVQLSEQVAAAALENADRPEGEQPSKYAGIKSLNEDFYGWLSIENTIVDYPVMFTPDDPEYYLHRAFDKSDAHSGTLFMDGNCYEGCGNYIIYGHHMKNGTMFGVLPKYAEKMYWEKNPTICFDTLNEHGEYEIIAAFYGKAVAQGDSGFSYYQYTDLTDRKSFEDYISQVKAAAIYDTGITAEYGDELITLSTCSYHTTDGRFVVVARKY